MESIINQSFSINLAVMAAFGLYPPETSKYLYKVQAYLMYSLFTLPIPVLGIVYFLVQGDFDMTRIDDNAFLIAEMACQITKLLPFISNGEKIKRCIHYFDSPFFKAFRQNHQRILDKSSHICKRNSTVFFLSVIGGNIFWATRPFFGKNQKLPVDIWLPCDPTLQPKFFFSVYIFLVTAVAYTSIACAAIDPLIGGLACLATGQLQVLKDKLQHLGKNTANGNYCQAGETTFNNKTDISIKIKECITHHNEIIRFVQEYEKCFSSAVFSQFVGSILVICFCCLQLSKVQPMSFNFISMVSFLSTFLVQIYIYCYYGTTLYEESNTLTNAVYMGNWYDYDMNSKKTLIILMERSKKPIIVTAGKIVDVSVGTFTTILRRSYSLLAVLKNQ